MRSSGKALVHVAYLRLQMAWSAHRATSPMILSNGKYKRKNVNKIGKSPLRASNLLKLLRILSKTYLIGVASGRS